LLRLMTQIKYILTIEGSQDLPAPYKKEKTNKQTQEYAQA